VFYALSGAYEYGKVLRKPAGITYLEALPEAPPLPWDWLSEVEMDKFVEAYTASGFTGGLNWYRSMDIKWRERKPYEGKTSPVPAWFIGSEYDVDLEHFHGDDPISLMRQQFPNLLDLQMIPGVGHLMQMEKPEETNAILLDYMRRIERSQ
jgi:pimeloyl-ACP methyl ester carboxylesterase